MSYGHIKQPISAKTNVVKEFLFFSRCKNIDSSYMPLTQQCAKIQKHPMILITRKFWHRLHSDVKNEWICIFWVLPFWVRDKINSITCAWPNALLIGYLNGLTESCHKNTDAVVSFRENKRFVNKLHRHRSMQRYDCLCTYTYTNFARYFLTIGIGFFNSRKNTFFTKYNLLS